MKRTHWTHYKWIFEYEKAVGKVGATRAYSRSKPQRVDDLKNCLVFLGRYVTMEETWLHHYTPESNRRSSEWTAREEPTPKCAKTQQSAGKVMAPIFWDAQGIIFICYLQKSKTVNSNYCAGLLRVLKDEMAKKQPHSKNKKVLFHQDNAPSQKWLKTMKKLHGLVSYPSYSSDLAPSDYFLFADLKRMFAGKKFISYWTSDCSNWGIF